MKLAQSGPHWWASRRLRLALVILAAVLLVSIVVLVISVLRPVPLLTPKPGASLLPTTGSVTTSASSAGASDGTPTATPSAWTAAPPDELGTSNLYIEYILDASGSMNEALPDGSIKLEVARDLLSEHLQAFRPETNIGLRAYGHRVPYQQITESCQDIELIAPVEQGQLETIVTWLGQFQAQGMTPLAESIRLAMEDFVFEPGRINSVVMISDGEETCDGDPCGLVEELKAQDINFTIYVIGLDVDESTREQLQCIAGQAGGRYHDARSEGNLKEALADVEQAVRRNEVVAPPGVSTPTPPPPTPTDTPEPPTATNTAEPPTPVPSPTARIAFISTRNGVSGIYQMDPDGTRVTLIISGVSGERLACAPDGARIAFSDYSDTQHRDIYVINTDGTGLRNLTKDDAWDFGAAWSPDGGRIAFGSYRGNNMDIYVTNDDGTGTVRLTNSPDEDGSPCWSPDGNWLVFDSAKYETRIEDGESYRVFQGSYLRRVNASGSLLLNLTDSASSSDSAPSWSPDGQRIAYACSGHICVMNPDGGERAELTQGSDWWPRWSPDGARILFMRTEGTNTEVYVMNSDGSGQSNLTNHPAGDFYPCWLP